MLKYIEQHKRTIKDIWAAVMWLYFVWAVFEEIKFIEANRYVLIKMSTVTRAESAFEGQMLLALLLAGGFILVAVVPALVLRAKQLKDSTEA